MREHIMLQRLIDNSAVIICDGDDSMRSFAAYPFGDRRRRPIAFVAEKTLKRFLADGVVSQKQDRYFIAESAAKRFLAKNFALPHQAQHQEIDRVTVTDAYGRFREVTANSTTRSPLLRLARRKDKSGEPFLNSAHLEAAAQLVRDQSRANLSLTTTASYDHIGASGSAKGPEDMAIGAIDSRRRFHAASDYMGAGVAQIVIDMCCEGLPLRAIESRSGYPRASIETLLKVGLERLAQFYGTYVGECQPEDARAAAASR